MNKDTIRNGGDLKRITEDLDKQVMDFVSALYGDDQNVYLRFYDDKKRDDINHPFKRHFTISELPYILPQMRSWNAQGYGVYIVVNGGGQTDPEVLASGKMHAQFMECDELSLDEQYKQIEAFPLEPSIMIQTAKSVHTYWLIKDGNIKQFRAIQIKLKDYFHGDPKVQNESRVMRLPTFYHNKNDPVLVKMVSFHPERVYTQHELNELLDRLLPVQEGHTDEKDKSKGKSQKVPEKVTEGSRNDFIYRRACQLQALDWTDDAIMRACLAENEQRLQPPLDSEEVEKAVASALKREKGSISEKKFRGIDLIYQTDKSGKSQIRQCAENVFRVIDQDPELAGRIKYDTFNYRIMYLGQLPWKEEGDTFGTWQEADDAELRNYLDMKYSLHVRTNYDDGFKMAVSRNKYNPLTGYLNALRWDGVHRIDTLLPDYLGADRNEYTSGVLHTFLQGMMHRAYDPGCKFDYMVVLVGPQGKGKSTFLRYLACRDEWYSEDFNFKSTDAKSTIELMEGKWLLEMGEMATLKKDSVSSDNIKAFITSMSDKYRVPYEKRSEIRKRQCVFAGTSNDINFLKDRTGGRRFLPVVIHPERIIKDIRDEKAARPEFEQAIAEAVNYYKAHPDEKPMLSDELTEYAEKVQREHLEEDGWVSMIQDFLDDTTKDRVNSACIWVNAFDKAEADMKRADSSRILTIMRNDIEGWHEIGKTRCSGFGRSLICFERDAEDPDEELSGTGFEQMADEEIIPF